MEEADEKKDPPSKDLNASALEYLHSLLKSTHFMKTQLQVPGLAWQEFFNVDQLYQQWFCELFDKPNSIWEANVQFWNDSINLFFSSSQAFLEKKALSGIKEYTQDKRFRHVLWNEMPQYFFAHQTYLLFSRHLLQFVEQNPCKDPKMTKQVLFFTRQMIDALSPANFIMTNPEVIKSIIDSKGENLIKGAKNFVDDIIRGHGHWAFRMTDMSAFEVGKNLAVTQGAIIYQNKMIQLIQYYPTTKQVYQVPLLIIPPWINKYYILDLTEKNSFVKYCVESGLTVFMISWVNPDKSYQSTSFEDYLLEGILPAIDVIQKITRSKTLNTLGFCIGGTLLASCLGYLQKIKNESILSATFLATLIDFSEPGELGVFIDKNQISTLEQEMESEGFLSGSLLMTIFNLLRENELFWPYYINNYLLGKSPHSFDLLYWNSDPTNLPAKMVSDYARMLYDKNQLCQSGLFKIKNVSIDLNQVQTPCYFIATEHDHIAPWESVFSGAQSLGSEVTFVLGQSGHIAGIVNPPTAKKYGYYFSAGNFNQFSNPKEWLSHTDHREGSWWEHWKNWVIPRSKEPGVPRIPGDNALFPILQKAPGDYVKKGA